MNKFQKIISIIFNMNDHDTNSKKSYSNDVCMEKPIEGYSSSSTTNNILDADTKCKLKKLIIHLATQKRKIGFNFRAEHIEIYFDENNFKQNSSNNSTTGGMYISQPSGYSLKSFNIVINEKVVAINNSQFKNDGFFEELSELLKDMMGKIENKLVDDTIEDMIDVSNYRRNMNLDELLDDSDVLPQLEEKEEL